MNALTRLLRTDESRTSTFQRLILATVVFPYGAQSLFGWFGGLGLQASTASLNAEIGMPRALAMFLIVCAAIGPILLALGLLARVGAAAVSVVLLFLLPTVFFPFALLGLAVSLPIVVRGAGALSIDRMIVKQRGSLPLYQETSKDEREVGRHIGQYEA